MQGWILGFGLIIAFAVAVWSGRRMSGRELGQKRAWVAEGRLTQQQLDRNLAAMKLTQLLLLGAAIGLVYLADGLLAVPGPQWPGSLLAAALLGVAAIYHRRGEWLVVYCLITASAGAAWAALMFWLAG